MRIWHAIVLMCIGIMAGCAGPAGQVKMDRELTHSVRQGQLPPEYRYYVTGRENSPNAVIGLNPKYQQLAKFWREIDADSEELVRAIENAFRYGERVPKASYLLTPDGETIGIYWSSLYFTSIKMGKDNGIFVYPPRVLDGGAGGFRF